MNKQNKKWKYAEILMYAIAIVLTILKLTGVIDWSWWLVTVSLWGHIAVIAVILIGGIVFTER